MLVRRYLKKKVLFPTKVLVQDPWYVKREKVPPSDFKFTSDILLGDFYLVIPSCAREVFFLQLLEKNVDSFLPAEGDGILITKRVLHG